MRMALESLAPGFRFRPTGEVILQSYLRPLINGEKLPFDILTEADIYGDKEPWKLFNPQHSHSYWVFTQLKKKRNSDSDSDSVTKQTKKKKIITRKTNKKKEGDSYYDRTAGCGFWKARYCNDIVSSDGEKIGFDREYTFKLKDEDDDDEGSGSSPNGNWIMHQFSFEGCDDLVICEIKNSNSGGTRKRKHIELDSNVTKKLSVADHHGRLKQLQGADAHDDETEAFLNEVLNFGLEW
ncbi:No apical meristem (NAM) protein [Corchorus capsularis]|uniref:No apical meristem (NAM) protein n=1 Tax=Corchorus capsularis TaxID=210143 RepID=A0A1R3G0D3_COCAP|nr:No apical meristem (NAM) protein [Corchorus capsularis]